MDRELSIDELNLLRVIRNSSSKMSYFILANSVGVTFDRMDILINKLVSLGHIEPDKSNEFNEYRERDNYFIIEDKRVEIDALLEKDFNESIIRI